MQGFHGEGGTTTHCSPSTLRYGHFAAYWAYGMGSNGGFTPTYWDDWPYMSC